MELHTQELKMPHAMIMQDFGRCMTTRHYIKFCTVLRGFMILGSLFIIAVTEHPQLCFHSGIVAL